MIISLNRKENVRELRKKFVLVCEGSETEPIYFRNYRTELRNNNIEVIILPTKYNDPKGLVKFCEKQIRCSLFLKKWDVIWCVFDWDNNRLKEIEAAYRDAKNVKVCLSNPSYELWYLLHYEYVCSKLTNAELNEKLKSWIPKYSKSENYFEKLKSKRENAISNAKKLNAYHEKKGTDLKSIDSNPSTQVFKIVEELLSSTQHSE